MKQIAEYDLDATPSAVWPSVSPPEVMYDIISAVEPFAPKTKSAI